MITLEDKKHNIISIQKVENADPSSDSDFVYAQFWIYTPQVDGSESEVLKNTQGQMINGSTERDPENSPEIKETIQPRL